MHTRTKASQHISKLVEVRAAAGVDANDAFLDPINFGYFLVVGATASKLAQHVTTSRIVVVVVRICVQKA